MDPLDCRRPDPPAAATVCSECAQPRTDLLPLVDEYGQDWICGFCVLPLLQLCARDGQAVTLVITSAAEVTV